METVRASITWPGADIDVIRLFVEPTPDWAADPLEEDTTVAVLRVLDENERYTDQVAGIEIVGFLDFDRWDELPRLDMLWRLPGEEPLPLEELLRRKQRELREHEKALASS